MVGFITAMYLYGCIVGAWEFSWQYGGLAFLMDVILAMLLSSEVKVYYRRDER